MDPMTIMLLMSGLSTGLGAFSSWQQQQRQRDLYKTLTDPNKIAGQTNALYSGLSDANRTAINRDIASYNAMHGVQDGGAADYWASQVYNQIEPQLRQQTLNSYLASLGQATNNTGQPMGNPNALAQVLPFLFLNKGNQGQTGIAPSFSLGNPQDVAGGGTSYGGGTFSSFSPQDFMPQWGRPVQFAGYDTGA